MRTAERSKAARVAADILSALGAEQGMVKQDTCWIVRTAGHPEIEKMYRRVESMRNSGGYIDAIEWYELFVTGVAYHLRRLAQSKGG